MPLPPGAIGAAREYLKQPRFDDHGFVPPQETVTIGYVLGAGPHQTDTAVGFPLTLEGFRGEQTFRIQLVPDSNNPELYWVKVAQSYGAVVYSWTSRHKTYSFLAVASDRPEEARDMDLAPASMGRRHAALQLHQETGLPYEVLRQLTRVAGTYNKGVLAIGLAGWLLQQAGNNLANASDRAERLTLMKNEDRLHTLEGFAPTAQLRTGDTLMRVCQGARLILSHSGKAKV